LTFLLLKNMPFIRNFQRSFRNAFKGIKEAFLEQVFRTLFVTAVIVGVSLLVFPFEPLERAVLFLVIVLVLSLELVNSQIERILDILRPDYCEEVRKMKDISAGAVLVASIGSVIIGVIIILPYLRELIEKF